MQKLLCPALVDRCQGVEGIDLQRKVHLLGPVALPRAPTPIIEIWKSPWRYSIDVLLQLGLANTRCVVRLDDDDDDDDDDDGEPS